MAIIVWSTAKKRNFRKNPPENDTTRWISRPMALFSICYNSIFGGSPNELNANPFDFCYTVSHIPR